MGEAEGVVFGHRDGHGFVKRDDGEPDVYISQQEMRSVLHRDRVRVRVVRFDRKGRPEGRVLEIIERRKAPIIGRLLNEGGAWLVAPEDRRYGQRRRPSVDERHRQRGAGPGPIRPSRW